jgi:hypothetical protein
MPVCGVEIKKAAIAPREAPPRFKDAAKGKTPHEHKGNGTPINTAIATAFLPATRPKKRQTKAGEIAKLSTPATKKPKSNHGAIACAVCQIAERMFESRTIGVNPYLKYCLRSST